MQAGTRAICISLSDKLDPGAAPTPRRRDGVTERLTLEDNRVALALCTASATRTSS